ncbi:hypothetical protein TNCV_3191631 [Trichonephila clavipes]|nr:hypothetical protein TNCV_3191631 [Trichonephila clavipes]
MSFLVRALVISQVRCNTTTIVEGQQRNLTVWGNFCLPYSLSWGCLEFTSVNPLIVTMSDMETEFLENLNHLKDPATLFPDFTKPGAFQSLKRGKAAQGNDKRRKQKDPKKKAVEPPPEETDNDKCRRHKEIQKRIKMTNGRLSFLEHCIQSEKEFPDLTDDDALVLNFKMNMMNSLPRRSKNWVS